MINIFSILLSITFPLILFGQGEKPIISYAQNKVWIDSLENSALETQIEMIKKRIIQDTAVYYPVMPIYRQMWTENTIYLPQNYVEGLDYYNLVPDTVINGFKGESRLLFHCNYNGPTRKYIFFQIKRDSSVEVSTIKEISNILSINNIFRVKVTKYQKEKPEFFGYSYGFGLIILDFYNLEDYRRIKKINE